MDNDEYGNSSLKFIDILLAYLFRLLISGFEKPQECPYCSNAKTL